VSGRNQPTHIGRFRITGRIGSGAMGVVYAADDEVMGRAVALKVLIADLESDPETRARFYREALAAARVLHPNVITIFDAGEDDGRSFIAMQLLHGAPLAQYLTKPEAAPLERKLDLMIQVCEGLSAAHAHGVVHRDLKPSNLFVQTDGLLKILDFGVARLADSSMTAAGTVLGTPDYMSPEQALGAQVSASSDIFSAGAVFHYMLSGNKPFKGPDLRSLLRQLATEDPEPLPAVPPILADIVKRAMAKDPGGRPERVDDLLAMLLRFRRTLARPVVAGTDERDRRLASRVDVARRAIESRDWTLAIRECQHALSLLPTHEGAAAMLAEARAGQVAEQREREARVAGHLDEAAAAIEGREFEAAEAAIAAVDALQRGLPETETMRERLADARSVAEFEAEVQRLVAEEIRHSRAVFRRGRADEAVQQLRAFIEAEPRAEALGPELERLERLRDVLASGAAAARRAASEHQRRATQLAERGMFDEAIAAARQALAADPSNEGVAECLDQLLVRAFEARVKREEERLVLERIECARPALDAARRALAAGYVDFAARAAAVAGRVAPASDDVRALVEDAAQQMEREDQEIVDLGPVPYEPERVETVMRPAPGVAVEPLRFDRAIGMLKSVFSKSAPVSPKRQGTRR
jgi:tetratricopeptide (TPR) repeat protein